MRLVFTPLAEQDLEAIADYIAIDSPLRALSFVQELRTQCKRIAPQPIGLSSAL
ncbi:MAG TPA: type II toxin-antitoxin system RelE/ParE family toxin [Pseudomonadales bacterium]|jgi:toxin ParE1/3/4|nr:type II toxin-antitoxin system RelE/ParE family toxin [Pseudomonadales bacterium]